MIDKPLESPVLQFSQKKKRPLLRAASFDDYEQIAAVEAASGLSTKPRDQWLHLWQSNPAYQQLRDWPIGWVLEDEAGRIVGSLENIPCLYRFAGRTYVGAFGRGWAVDLAYRGFALLLLVRYLKQPNIDLRVTTTASPRTSALLTKRGWSRVPAGEWDRSAFWVTSYVQAVPRYLAAKASKLVSAVAGPLLYPPLRLADIVYGRSRRFETRCELRWCTDFDERFDEFSAELESQNPAVLLSTRTRQTLQWHFKYAREQNRIWILTACDGPQLLAYAILERKSVQSMDLTRVMLVDFQTLSKDRDLGSAMIASVLERCRGECVNVLENVGCWLDKSQPLVHRAPHRRRLGHWCYLYHAAKPELATALENAKSWYPTQYDADASL
jgi:hypothetical protein